ncbi:hypothetical protein EJ03DRAFT_319037 [Teratosphaeria nubilosa]|uniref:Uncharacterized protein n=1 Tax=Teratosphaeria nubilosa TaxID=161662 RepID=A0A6G1KZC8_9PEZI|nr:hypothetical protein EJ03DRAFT_319037 [Teratosphaeria nubilosa]
MAMARQHPHSPFVGSPSPEASHAPHPPTKRDVRRNRIMERLQTMIDSFNSNQHQHYRAQLQAAQVDMTLILRADPYESGPLDDSGAEIQRLVQSTMGQQGIGGDEAVQRDFLAMAGKRYADFVEDVNECLEERDTELAALHDHYHASVRDLERVTQQKLFQADEEHKALSETIRQRLITTLTKKRQHLLRDKEQLDIADSNALLLNPNQYSINNPGSPTGGQGRKTRHMRHRATSPGAEGENGKRKRKAAALEEEGGESPAPAFRLPPPDALGGGRSPFKDAREKSAYTQFEAPAYSLERIFTDKELQMATATAQQATYRHFHTPQQQQQPQDQNGTANGTGVSSVDGEVVPDAGAEGEERAHPTTETGAGTPPPVAPEMERSASHQVLTRGGARANPLQALSELANVATATASGAPAPPRDNPFAPVVPTFHAVARAEKLGAPAPPSVSQLDAQNDFEMMFRREHDDDEDEYGSDTAAAAGGAKMRRQLLDQALGISNVTQPYRLPPLEVGAAIIGKGVDRPSYTGFAQPAVYEAQKAKQKFSNFGAGTGGAPAPTATVGASLAAALQGRLPGGEPMSRTTSAGGASEVGGPGVGGPVGRGRGRLV